eukprot:scaffold287010_cov33-Tisochrysis_lutea.AAC.1
MSIGTYATLGTWRVSECCAHVEIEGLCCPSTYPLVRLAQEYCGGFRFPLSVVHAQTQLGCLTHVAQLNSPRVVET